MLTYDFSVMAEKALHSYMDIYVENTQDNKHKEVERRVLEKVNLYNTGDFQL